MQHHELIEYDDRLRDKMISQKINKSIFGNMRREGIKFHIIEDSGEIVGVLTYHLSLSKRLCVATYGWIRESHRGDSLLQDMVAEVKQNESVTACVAYIPDDLRSYYESEGWQHIGDGVYYV